MVERRGILLVKPCPVVENKKKETFRIRNNFIVPKISLHFAAKN